MPSDHDRLLPLITLTSPTMKVMTAKWADDTRSGKKTIQRDRYPLIAGETSIDLGGEAFAYSIPLIFDGPMCDLLAEQFVQATKDVSPLPWTIVHPVHGTLSVRLLDFSQEVAPVKSGGVVRITTTWMDYLDPLLLASGVITPNSIDAAIAALGAASAAGAAASMAADTFGDVGAILNAISIASAVINEVAGQIYTAKVNADAKKIAEEQSEAASTDLAACVVSAQSGVENFDASATVVALQKTIQAPILAGPEPLSAISQMSSLVSTISEKMPTTASSANYNKAKTYEVTLEAALGASCLAATMAELSTRTQAIQAAQALIDMLDEIVDTMDTLSETFEDEPRASSRYYAQTESYNAAVDAVTSTVRYLLQQSFNLKIEKRFTLERDKTPIQIVMEEYGADGESYLEEFIALNHLFGDQVVLLDAGTPVVLYVKVTM